MSIPQIVMLCGGVGGARGALALAENLPPEKLTFVVNTGDDFTHLGLPIWPDWDTVVYHLAGLQDTSRGWGRADEGVKAMEEFRRLGVPHWFHLGDRDLALHVARGWMLKQRSANEVARSLRERLGVRCSVLRASVESLATEVILDNGESMAFQDWFVGQRCEPRVAQVRQAKLSEATVEPAVLEALTACELLLYAPSNPYLSIQPMLRLTKLAAVLEGLSCPRWAVSPLIGGRALKGPLDSLIETLASNPGQQAILDFYRPWADQVLMPPDELPQSDETAVGSPTLLSNKTGRRAFVDRLRELWS